MKRKVLFFTMLLLLIPIIACALGPKVFLHNLAWDAPTQNVDGTPLTDLGGYFVYWKSGSQSYSDTQRKDIGNVTLYDLMSLGLSGGSYNMTVSAYSTSGNESALASPDVTWFNKYPNPPGNERVLP